jgi:hypothetical protein
MFWHVVKASTKPPAARYRCTRATSQVSAAACSSFVSRGLCCETMLAIAMTILLIVSSTGLWGGNRNWRQNSKLSRLTFCDTHVVVLVLVVQHQHRMQEQQQSSSNKATTKKVRPMFEDPAVERRTFCVQDCCCVSSHAAASDSFGCYSAQQRCCQLAAILVCHFSCCLTLMVHSLHIYPSFHQQAHRRHCVGVPDSYM